VSAQQGAIAEHIQEKPDLPPHPFRLPPRAKFKSAGLRGEQ
jgi:hypothetical protein